MTRRTSVMRRALGMPWLLAFMVVVGCRIDGEEDLAPRETADTAIAPAVGADTLRGDARDTIRADAPASDRPADGAEGPERDMMPTPVPGPILNGGASRLESEEIAGTYELTQVEGEALPAVVGEGPDCVLQISRGRLIVTGATFSLETRTEQVCDGQVEERETQATTGTVSESGSRVRFEATVEGAFGYASGRIDGRAIVIEEVGTEGDAQTVRWTFVR